MDDDIDEIKQQKMEELQEQEDAGEGVEIFTTPTCPYCKKLKQWLEKQGVDYTEHNVAEDREQAMRMVRRTGQQGVPQTFVNGHEIIGFQPQKVKAALEG